MKFWKTVVLVVVFSFNLCFASNALANRLDLTKSTDYQEVTTALVELQKTTNPTIEQTQAIGNLQLQKYILETAKGGAICSNQTGKPLGVYGPKAKKATTTYDNSLYVLANGQVTDDDWDCEGLYIPVDVKVRGVASTGTQPVALKFVDGTQLVVTTNPETGEIELNLPPAKVLEAGKVNWLIPDNWQSVISTLTNAPND